MIAPLIRITVGSRFEQKAIPLHLTTLPKFRVMPEDATAVVAAIAEVAAATGPIIATATAYADFGPDHDVRVTTVDPTPELRLLHSRLLESVRRVGAVPLAPAYSGDGYRPHITHTKDGRAVVPGEKVDLRSLAILDCTQPTLSIPAVAPLSGPTPGPPIP